MTSKPKITLKSNCVNNRSTFIIKCLNNIENQMVKNIDMTAGYSYSSEKPMDGVSYNYKRNKYLARIDGKQTYYKELNVICDMKKHDIIRKLRNKYKYVTIVDNVKVCKIYPDFVVSFEKDNTRLFDTKHIMSVLDFSESQICNVKNLISYENIYVFFETNEYNGYTLRELVNLDAVKKILNHSNKIGARKLAEILGINVCDIFLSTKEQTHIGIICDVFTNENKIDQFCIGGYRIDLYFSDYKLAIECDENGHYSRNQDHEKIRQSYIESHGVSFIRFNPDDDCFNIYRVIGNIHTFMIHHKIFTCIT